MREIDVAALQALLEAGELELIDVREPAEWATGHVPGARHVPLGQLRGALAASLPRDHVAFICAKGGRSAAAAKLAEQAGKQHVYSVAGGTEAWIAAGLDVASSAPAGGEQSGSQDALMPELEAVVGKNLKAQRTQRGVSLDALAQEAGVSRTLLGQIEIGKASPTVRVIWKIAQALGVPYATLLSTETSYGTTVTHRKTARKLSSADGRFSSRALFRLGDPSAAEFYELWFAPHSREDAEPHRPGTRENLVVTAGQLELRIGSERVLLEAGDSVNFAADIPHSYINPSAEACWAYLVMNYAAL
jgi:rhodanese-related sulfurtransferase/transcriptional regulator with XRE-family HTH domain